MKTKIGPNERTGMSRYFEVRLDKKKYSDSGDTYSVWITEHVNNLPMRVHVAASNGYFGYKNKADAIRLYKEVVNVIKSSGSDELFEQRGALRIKGEND